MHPDKTYGHHVHDALDLPGHKATAMDINCTRVLHLINLISKRWPESLYTHLTVPIDSFQWALTQHAEFWQPDDS